MPNADYKNNSPDYFFELGIRELDCGNIDKAIEAFKKAIEANPDDPRSYSNLGIAYELTRDYEKAREAYEKAIEINPKNLSAVNNLAGLSLLQGQPDEALSLFDESISSDPLYVEPYLNIARFFMETREFEAAEFYLRKVIDIENDNNEARNLLGIVTNMTERPEEAVEHNQEALRRDANESSVLSNLGTAFRNTGDLKRAIIAFEKAGELNPGSITIMNNLGVLYRETGFFEKAEGFFKRAIDIFPENPFPYFNIAELFIAMNEYDRAVKYLKKYVSLVPLDMDNLFKTCGIARLADRLIDVVQEMNSFIREADPSDPRVEVVKKWLAMSGKE